MSIIEILNSRGYTRKTSRKLICFPEISTPYLLKIEIARLVCNLIPASCPFARDVLLLGRTVHIPPLCKLNPAYNFLMNLRWQSLEFLAQIDAQ